MRIAVTGARGFVGRNLLIGLRERGHTDIVTIAHDSDDAALRDVLRDAEFVFHLAGVNRPERPEAFADGNVLFTRRVVAALGSRSVPVVFASTIRAAEDTPYGRSKAAAEAVLAEYGQRTGAALAMPRLPNIFGKWCKPNYNSAVATFCHQASRGEAPTVHDPNVPLRLLYIDDLVAAFADCIAHAAAGTLPDVRFAPVYETTVGEVAALVVGFASDRRSLMTRHVGTGLERALYATFVSQLRPVDFAYEVPRHADSRGVFVEMLRTPSSGQFSYFTAGPGITRGEHYHHTKCEKFLVLKGTARFGYRDMATDERYELVTHGGDGRVVESIPGWAHDVTNVGDDELVVMLWASELFDRERPDTVAAKVQ